MAVDNVARALAGKALNKENIGYVEKKYYIR